MARGQTGDKLQSSSPAYGWATWSRSVLLTFKPLKWPSDFLLPTWRVPMGVKSYIGNQAAVPGNESSYR